MKLTHFGPEGAITIAEMFPDLQKQSDEAAVILNAQLVSREQI